MYHPPHTSMDRFKQEFVQKVTVMQVADFNNSLLATRRGDWLLPGPTPLWGE